MEVADHEGDREDPLMCQTHHQTCQRHGCQIHENHGSSQNLSRHSLRHQTNGRQRRRLSLSSQATHRYELDVAEEGKSISDVLKSGMGFVRLSDASKRGESE